MRGGSIIFAIARADTLARTLERCSIKIQSSVYKTPWLRARRNPGLMPYAGIRKGPLPGRASVDPNSPLNGGDHTRSVGISQERTRNGSPFGCTQAPPKPAPTASQTRAPIDGAEEASRPGLAHFSPDAPARSRAMSHGSPVRTALPPRKCRTRASGLPAVSVDLPNTSGPERMTVARAPDRHRQTAQLRRLNDPRHIVHKAAHAPCRRVGAISD